MCVTDGKEELAEEKRQCSISEMTEDMVMVEGGKTQRGWGAAEKQEFIGSVA